MWFWAALVHLFTALGAVAALMATLALFDKAWEQMFLWLGVAFVIDGIDGTFARRVGVEQHLPRFSGERLDLVVDFLTYVFVPTLALLAAGFLPGAMGVAMGGAILVSSLFHFSDLVSKAEDHSFVGFPAVWNIVAFYLFALQASPGIAQTVCVLCVILTFVPMPWVHPFRVERLRMLTIAVTLLWSAAAISSVVSGFGSVSGYAKAALVIAAVYLAGLSVVTWAARRFDS